jgi:hypothetical protein
VRRGTPPDASYNFKHALIQDAAYGSLLRATRQDYHRRIAAALERQSAGTAKTDAALLAHHYAEGGMIEPAIRYLRQAGETAVGPLPLPKLSTIVSRASRCSSMYRRVRNGPVRKSQFSSPSAERRYKNSVPARLRLNGPTFGFWSSASDPGP